MKKSFKSLVLILVLFLFGTSAVPMAVGASEDDIVTIMHTNDMHGRIEPSDGLYALARVKGYKDNIKPLLMFDGGDAFQGLPISNASKGADMARIMNEVGYDAMVVGNHEFDFGSAVALGKEDGFGKVLDFPLLSSNTVYNDNSLLFKPTVTLDIQNGQSQTLMKDNYKIVVTGATTPETHTKTHPKNIEGIKWNDPIPAVTEELEKAEHQDADFFVVLTHLGIDKETKTEWRSDTLAESLAANPKLKDKPIIIVDGHSHTPIEKGIFKGDNVILVQTGEHLNNLGVVNLNLTNFKNSTAKLIPITKDLAEPDPVVKGLIDDAYEGFKESVSGVVLNDNKIHFNGQREFVRTRETNLGNAITDAMVAYGKEGFRNPTDFAMINGGGIRKDIKPGVVTEGDIIGVLPFGNITSQIQVTGTQILQMFEHSVRTTTTEELDAHGMPLISPNGGYLHVSNTIRVIYDTTKEPGSRVLGVYIYDGKADEFLPLDLNRTYYMATNDFLAAGGDGYSMLGGAREEGPSLDRVFVDYLKNNKAVDWELYDAELKPYRLLTMLERDYNHALLDYDVLDQLIKEAEALDATLYTKESYDAVIKNLEHAKTLLLDNIDEDEIITQEMIDDAATQLKQIIVDLKKIVEPKDPETEKPEDPAPEVEKEKERDKGKLPGTGVDPINASLIVGAATLSLGSAAIYLERKRKQ